MAGGMAWLIRTSDLHVDRAQELGAGSFARVFKGEYHHATVAIKELCPSAGAEQQHEAQQFMQKLYFECQLLSTMHHPHIVKFFGLSRPPGPPPVVHIVTEFCGSDLARMMCTPEKAGHAVPLRWLTFAKQITSALQYIHSKGIIHRDLKPANVLVTADSSPGGKCIKLCDFGISTQTDGEVNRSRTATGLQGTPVYMAPEVADEEETRYGSAVDVYSLSVLLWAMWTGMQPYHDVPGTMVRLLGRICVEGLRPGREFLMSAEHGGENTAVPWCLWRLLTACWAPDPHARHTIERVMAVLEKESFAHDIEHHRTQAAALPPPQPQSRNCTSERVAHRAGATRDTTAPRPSFP